MINMDGFDSLLDVLFIICKNNYEIIESNKKEKTNKKCKFEFSITLPYKKKRSKQCH